MTTATKKPRPAQSISEIIRQGFLQHEGYQAAQDKLQKLEMQLAAVLAEHDQAAAEAKTDIQELASRILRGDELDGREQLFARREALKQKVEAFRAAIATQKQEVDNQRQLASVTFKPALDPINAERIEQIVAAVDALGGAVAALQSFYAEIHGLHHSYGMANLGRIVAMVPMLKSLVDQHRQQ